MLRHTFSRSGFLLLLLTLGGCGFHLRNALALPSDLGPLRVVSRDRYSSLGESLSEALARAGAVPAPELPPPTGDTTAAAGGDDAAVHFATLRIRSERWGTTPLSVNQRGRAQEFTLRYAVVFNLTRADGSELVPEQVIELARDYISVPTNSSGTEGEREILAREMRREMVASILRRIDAASRAPAPVGAPPATPPPEAPPPTPPPPPPSAS
ncbi:MAG: LPS assembly lipoprotein LptE [Luteimonas sp.]